MNVSKNISLALAALAVVSTSFAQTAPAATASTGLLGQRYAEASFGLADAHGSSDNTYGLGLGVNLPVSPNVDLGFNYGYSWLNSGGLKLRDHALNATATGYTNYAGVKPFVGVGLGYQWAEAKFGPFKTSDDAATWGLGLGFEVAAGEITLTPSISYVDGFKSRDGGAFNYGIAASTWITKTLGGFADVSFSDVEGRGGQSWNYTVGVRVRF